MAHHLFPLRRISPETLSGILAVALLAAAVALVAVHPSEAAITATVALLVAVSVISLLTARGYRFKNVGLSNHGLTVEMAELKRDLDMLGVAVTGLRTVPERLHLEALAGPGEAIVEFRETLVDELDRLENMENIESTDQSDPRRRIRDSLWAGPGQEWLRHGKQDTFFDLKDYARIRPAGEKYLAAYRQYQH
ncbi:hypothetical protein [Streptomyces sp. NPDC059649]|uniref:hypothetical protein n=1 Tax=Streptomyces sp. NPDC059649 TaxID=3346895 RepID=UPI0036917133